ncbi:MAG: SRPBCC family protein [Terrimesophilobacter sp.]
MGTVNNEVDVEAPISAVYNQWTRFSDFPRFMSGVNAITQLDDRRLHWEVSILGVDREFDAEITDQTPDERIAWRSLAGEVKHAGVVTFHRLAEDSTRVSLDLDWDPHGFVEKAGEVLQVDNLQIHRDLTAFKTLMEENGFDR